MTAGYMTARRVLYRFGESLKRAGLWLLDSWRQFIIGKFIAKEDSLFVGTKHRDYLKIFIYWLWEEGRMEGAYVLDFRAPYTHPQELAFRADATVVPLHEGEEDRAAGLLKAARSHLVMVVGADLENPRLREVVKNARYIGTPKLVVAADDAPREVRGMFPLVIDTDWY